MTLILIDVFKLFKRMVICRPVRRVCVNPYHFVAWSCELVDANKSN